MELLRLLALVAQVSIVAVVMWAGTRLVINRQRARTAGLRREIEAQPDDRGGREDEAVA